MTLTHPYADLTGGAWLRGNLHAHSTRSDGARRVEDVIADYARRGYGFLMLSDHDVTSTREECAAWSAAGEMIVIPGNEISARGPHLLHVDADRHIAPLESRQEVLSQITARAAMPGGRGFTIVNHPNWERAFNHCTIAQLCEWTGYVGIEIYNGVIARLHGSQYATDKWDMLLAAGRRVWGFANDDSHAAAGDTELGWNVAYVKSHTLDGVIDALRRGRFYASTGVRITDIRVTGDTIRIETENAQRITALADTARRIAVADDRSIEVRVPDDVKYVRFECWGSGERFAWTQPFFVEAAQVDSDIANRKSATKFIEDWDVSPLFGDLKFEDAQLISPESSSGWKRFTAAPSDHAVPGFVSVRSRIENLAGIIYLTAIIPSDAERRGRVFLGYDGPVRVWMNDRQIFEGPGTNPATPDKVALYAMLRRGNNRLTIALDTNGGRTWGIFGRVEI